MAFGLIGAAMVSGAAQGATKGTELVGNYLKDDALLSKREEYENLRQQRGIEAQKEMQKTGIEGQKELQVGQQTFSAGQAELGRSFEQAQQSRGFAHTEKMQEGQLKQARELAMATIQSHEKLSANDIAAREKLAGIEIQARQNETMLQPFEDKTGTTRFAFVNRHGEIKGIAKDPHTGELLSGGNTWRHDLAQIYRVEIAKMEDQMRSPTFALLTPDQQRDHQIRLDRVIAEAKSIMGGAGILPGTPGQPLPAKPAPKTPAITDPFKQGGEAQAAQP